jgi:hypothetical protein
MFTGRNSAVRLPVSEHNELIAGPALGMSPTPREGF